MKFFLKTFTQVLPQIFQKVSLVALFVLCCQSYSAFAQSYAACNFETKQAYKDLPMIPENRDPSNDWICLLPPDNEIEPRCPAVQESMCVDGKALGPHNVPNGGAFWFHAVSSSTHGLVRCTCGCFEYSTGILAEFGSVPIHILASHAERIPVRIMTRSTNLQDNYLVFSSFITGNKFTSGNEEKELYKISTQNGLTISVTGNHPILVVLENGEQEMIRAEEVTQENNLLDQDGNIAKIYSIKNVRTHLKVFNLDTDDSDPSKHVVIANGIQTGDNKWQKALDVKKWRLKLRGLDV
jgi:hypothetical protein